MRRLGVLALGVLLAGCGQTLWYKAGATQQDFQQAKYYCLRDAGYYTPNPYSPLVQGNNDPSWGLAGLFYQLGQKRQYNDCMRAQGWSTTPPAATTALDSTSGQARVKIGYVDLQRALTESNTGQKAKAEFKACVDKVEAEIKVKRDRLDQLKGQIEQGTLETDARREIEIEYDEELRAFKQAYLDRQAELQKLDNEMTGKIIQRLRECTAEIGNRDGYTVIMEHPSGWIVYGTKPPMLPAAAPGSDLTQELIDVYNSQSQRGVQSPGASAEAQSSWESAVVQISSERSVGSGFFVSDNVVATNAHVVQGSKTVLVSLGEKSDRASVAYKDRELDFALIRTSIVGVPLPVRPANIPLTDGENVMTLGFPQGRRVVAASTGTVRGILECCIIHDALVAAGSSGGPLLDANSRVIGINTGLSKTRRDKANESDRIWALKMSYILERLQAVADDQSGRVSGSGHDPTD